ncbi:MAG TPA: hypothetical protein VIF57_26495 [Polyangia bacterium]|jgi:hypothetical protein
MRETLRNAATRVIAVLGVVTLTGGLVLAEVRHALFDGDAFAERLSASLSDPRVSAYVAETITTTVVREKADLVAVRPFLLSVAQGVVSSDAFAGLVRVAARQAHAGLFSRGGRNLLLSVPDVDVILRGALANASPTLAARVPPLLPTVIARLGGSSASRFILDLWQLGGHLAWAARIGAFVGFLLLVLAVATAPRRAEALRHASLDLALAGLLILMLQPLGRRLVSLVPDAPIARAAAADLYDAFTHGLDGIAYGLVGVGLVLAAAAQSLLGRSWLPDTARRAWAFLAHAPASPALQLARGAVLLAAGVLVVLRPWPAIATLGFGAGVALAFVGLQQLFRVILRGPREQPAAVGHGAGRGVKVRAVVTVAVAGALALALAWLGRPIHRAIVRAPAGCNGDQRLCARRLDQVAFPATHNAMSAAAQPGWMFAAQEDGLADQLADGVRAFLIDAYGGIPVSGRIKTDFGGAGGMPQEMEQAVGKEGAQAAERIRARLTGAPEGPRAVYLCHGFCEVGAELFVDWLRTLREFLAANPSEVVILVIEDYVPPPEIAAAFQASGVAALAFRGPPGPPWPTLAALGASGRRVVTFLESGTPGVDWLFPAFASIQETPYRFPAASQLSSRLSCAPNRGGTAGSLFQINHWVETAPAPRPSNAAIVNAHDFLLGRVRRCAEARAHLPNIVAVDFYRRGDLFGVVRALNGLDARP